MTSKFQQKFRIKSARLPNWDYGSQSSYFITICTKNRDHYFGKIKNGEMLLNEIGEIASQFWKEIPNHFPHVGLGNFVVMPNHTHGVLIMGPNHSKKRDLMGDDVLVDDVSDGRDVAVQRLYGAEKNQMSSISPKPGSISTIIRSYKSVVTKNAKKFNPEFQWQPRFHDHVIRNEYSFENIQKYIVNNPINWKEDRFF
jgi:REP element-mobilizing transposase RayT